MKNLLLASTMLIASATIANAQALTISGEGRMGVMFHHVGVWTWICLLYTSPSPRD